MCAIQWNKKSLIGKVHILDGQNHEYSGFEVWVCGHHHTASVLGYKLQVQLKERGMLTRNKEEEMKKRKRVETAIAKSNEWKRKKHEENKEGEKEEEKEESKAM